MRRPWIDNACRSLAQKCSRYGRRSAVGPTWLMILCLHTSGAYDSHSSSYLFFQSRVYIHSTIELQSPATSFSLCGFLVPYRESLVICTVERPACLLAGTSNLGGEPTNFSATTLTLDVCRDSELGYERPMVCWTQSWCKITSKSDIFARATIIIIRYALFHSRIRSRSPLVFYNPLECLIFTHFSLCIFDWNVEPILCATRCTKSLGYHP